ncbi:MAG TPA: hypothetical protein VLG45_06820 [Thermodesulfobacteriota bacterium]|nr:hypothetical protein [Thermodesulfobacteriota bacterium]
MDPNSGAKRLMGYAFLVVFANDDTISAGELHMLEKIALEDHVIDEDEKRILRTIFSRVTKDQLADAVWKEITKFREDNGI